MKTNTKLTGNPATQWHGSFSNVRACGAIVCCCIVLMVAAAARATVNVINFDDVANNTLLDTQYPGLTFANELNNGHVYARGGWGFAPSSPNVVSLRTGTGIDAFFDARDGAVRVALPPLVRSVSIDARPVGPLELLGAQCTSKPYIQAYDSSSLSDLTNGILARQGGMRDTRLYNRPAKSESADFAGWRQRSQREPMERALGFSGPRGLLAAS